jgi:2TM domain
MEERRETGTSPQAAPEATSRPALPATSRRLVRAFPLHFSIFLAVNAALLVVNAFTGGYWWAFWPLLATGFLVGVHYLFYKAVAVDERWVEERVEELNLKSYDRGHIEDLKARYDGKSNPGDRRD